MDSVPETEGQNNNPIEIEDDDGDDQETNGVPQTAKPAIVLPPGIKDLDENPKVFRQYVAYLATTTPVAPSRLKGQAIRDWQDTHLFLATVKQLESYFQGLKDTRGHVWAYYESNLIVNNTDYPESRFQSYASQGSLYSSLHARLRKCDEAAGLNEKGGK